jgi:hypothetical protein
MFGQSSGTQSVDAQSSANNSSAPVPTPSTFGFTGTSSLFGQQQ